MLAVEWVQWWYGDGYRRLVQGIGRRIHRLVLVFSLPLLIRTLGAPWRRIVTPGGGSLGDRFHAMIDNLVSRCVGLIVRCIVIITAIITIILTAVGGALLAVIWPFLPLAAVGLIIWGLLP